MSRASDQRCSVLDARAFLRHALACLQREHTAMDMVGVGVDFSQSLQLPPEVGESPRTLLFSR